MAEIRSCSADYDAARTKTARGAIITRPTCNYSHAIYYGCVRLDTIRRPRQLMEAVPDAYSRRCHAHFSGPWQVFQRWPLQSQEGPLHQGSATPRCLEHRVFPRPTATVSQARWCASSGSSSSRNNFLGCYSDQNLFREDVWTVVATTLSRPPSNQGRTCRRQRGLGRCSKDL